MLLLSSPERLLFVVCSINAETHNWPKIRKIRDCHLLSLNPGIYSILCKTQETFWKRGWEECKSWRVESWQTTRRCCLNLARQLPSGAYCNGDHSTRSAQGWAYQPFHDEIIPHGSHPSLMAVKGIIFGSDVASDGQLFTGAWATYIHASKQT